MEKGKKAKFKEQDKNKKNEKLTTLTRGSQIDLYRNYGFDNVIRYKLPFLNESERSLLEMENTVSIFK